jgi:hypothetical protein
MHDTSGYAWALQTVVGVALLAAAMTYVFFLRPRRVNRAGAAPDVTTSRDDLRPHPAAYAMVALLGTALVVFLYSIGHGTIRL